MRDYGGIRDQTRIRTTFELDLRRASALMICLKYLANKGRYVRNNTLRWLYLDSKGLPTPQEYTSLLIKRHDFQRIPLTQH